MKLQIFNSLTHIKEDFVPQNHQKIGMYVCGPTVYDHPHIGNARSVVVYDLLYRALLYLFGFNKVHYIRNITDVDDKINARAKELGIDIKTLTTDTTKNFLYDMEYLKCLLPNTQPRATEHIDVMLELIDKLIERNHAYIASDGNVYFRVTSFEDYGKLSGRNSEDMIAGSRIDVLEAKEEAADFVLWKLAQDLDDPSAVFESRFGKGRPGWHIECSAMSYKYLGADFDIHGGGADLIFPHHTNEIAQSCCANPGSNYAKYWVHNGFVTVNGQKMSKSLGNFITVRDLINEGVKGEIIRYMLLGTHYRKPLDFTQKSLEDAKIALDYLYRAISGVIETTFATPPSGFLDKLLDDLNIHEAFVFMHDLAKRINKEEDESKKQTLILELKACGSFLGFFSQTTEEWFGVEVDEEIENFINARLIAKQNKDWDLADKIRQDLEIQGIILEDGASGTKWRRI